MAKKKHTKREAAAAKAAGGDFKLDPVVEYAVAYGHVFNPEFPKLTELWDQGGSSLAKLKPGHPLYKELTASIQSFDANMDTLTGVYHGRQAMFDGDIGPATRGLLDSNRCACKDFDDPRQASGSGAWPIGCDPEYPDVHSIRIAVNSSGANRAWKQHLPRIMEESAALSASIGLHVRYLLDVGAGPSDAEEWVIFQVIPGNVIGDNYLPQADKCGQSLRGRIDPGYNPSNVILRIILWIHENQGHGIGLRHTRGGIMNPSIILVPYPLTWIGDPSFNTLRRFYGGKPLEPVDPTPPPSPGPSGFKLRGIFELEKDGVLTGDRWTTFPV